MSAPPAGRAAAGDAMARWSAKALLITAGVFLVGGAIWYARAATVPLIVWAAGRGIKRGIAIAGCLIGVILISAGLAWLFTDALFGNLGGVGDDISAGVDKAITWLRKSIKSDGLTNVLKVVSQEATPQLLGKIAGGAK